MFIYINKLFTVLLVNYLVLGVTIAQDRIKPLPVEDVLNMNGFISEIRPALSPDGNKIAYTVRKISKENPGNTTKFNGAYTLTGVPIDQASDCDILITDINTSQTINITKGVGVNWGPSWSPNGKFLAFNSDRSGEARIWIWDLELKSLRSVTNSVIRFFEPSEIVKWTPDSKYILAKFLKQNIRLSDIADIPIPKPSSRSKYLSRTKEARVNVYDSEDVGNVVDENIPFFTMRIADLVIVDVLTGNMKIVGVDTKSCWYQVSPDGRYIAYTNIKHSEALNSYSRFYDLVLYDLSTGVSRVLVQNIRNMVEPFVSWSPTSKALSYVEWGPKANGDCYVVSIDTGITKKVTDKPHPNFGRLFQVPIWDREGKNIYFAVNDELWKLSIEDNSASLFVKLPDKTFLEILTSPHKEKLLLLDDGKSMVAMVQDNSNFNEGFCIIDMKSGDYSYSLINNRSFSRVPAIDCITDKSGEAKIIYQSESSDTPPDIWVTDNNLKTERRVSDVNPQFANNQLGKSSIIEWLNDDGEVLHGALLLPAGYSNAQKYPLIVELYGGRKLSTKVNNFGLSSVDYPIDNKQLLATRGYAVLLADSVIKKGTPMLDIAKSILPGINKVIEMGIVDKDRIGIMGQSFGGYSTLSMIVQTNRFKAAICSAGYANVITANGQMTKDSSAMFLGWNEEGRGSMGGSLWDYRERYIENSPIFYFDRVTTPLLLIHGELDDHQLANEIYISLKRLGKKVVFAHYQGEFHSINNYYNRMDYCYRMIDWFDEHLKTKLVKGAVGTIETSSRQ